MKKKALLIFVCLFSLAACVNNGDDSKPSQIDPIEEEDLDIDSKRMYVYGQNGNIQIYNANEGETFSYYFDGNNIRIEDNKIIALKAGTKTEVSVVSSEGRSGEFTVEVINRAYTSNHAEAEEKEGWFNEVDISKVESMNENFANGMDISSLKQLYDNGQKFYNKEGNEQSLLYILKDAGVNWIRLRLWHDPKDSWEENGEIKTNPYGGGNCTTENMLWIAKEAKAAKLKVLLDFHYSDFWTDPNHQFVPKAWLDISSVEALAAALKNYTKETIETFIANNARPDAVAIGNEVYSGMLIHEPNDRSPTKGAVEEPLYSLISNRKDRYNSSLGGRWDQSANKANNANLRAYIKAGIDGVKEVDDSILVMLHTVKGFSNPQISINFFSLFDDLNYDICGMSGYSYYHFSNISTLRNGLGQIANAFPNKKICIAETSYGFTYEKDQYAANIFSTSHQTCHTVSGYGANIQDQARMLRDTTEVVSDLTNGWGVFYWEGAWTPTKNSGWAGEASKATWANQGLFSYDGKALGSLGVYNKMLGK